MFKYFLPKDTRYHGFGQLVIEKKPHKRTILTNSLGGVEASRSYLSLPYCVFIISYFPIGIWPFRFLFFYRFQVAFRDKPLTDTDRKLYLCPFEGSNFDSRVGVCLGDRYGVKFYFTLKGMAADLIGRFWQTPFLNCLQFKMKFKDQLVKDTREWEKLTKKHGNFTVNAEFSYLGSLDDYLNFGKIWKFRLTEK